MKKILSILLAGAMLAGCVLTGCSDSSSSNQIHPTEILQKLPTRLKALRQQHQPINTETTTKFS